MMDIFPTQYSTLSSAALNHHIGQRYGLKNMRCRYLLRGVSDTYVVETTPEHATGGNAEKYIFKVYRDIHRSLEEIKGETALLEILKEKGAKVSYPIYDLEGQVIQAFRAAEGIRHGVLFSYAKGKSSQQLSDRQLLTIGREMAYNHNITAGLVLPYHRKSYGIDTTLNRPLQILAPAFKDFGAEYASLQEIAVIVRRKMEAINTSSFGYGYCHYDYFPKNFFFDENDTMTLFDFDFAGKGLLANDLAGFHVHQFFEEFNQRKTAEENVRNFSLVIAGYREQRALGEEEIGTVPLLGYMLLSFYLAFQYEHFDDFSNTYFSPQHVQRFSTAILQYARQHGVC